MQAKRKKFPGRVGVAGLAENKANSAQLELELGLSLAIFAKCLHGICLLFLPLYILSGQSVSLFPLVFRYTEGGDKHF